MPVLRIASTPVRRFIYSALILGIIAMAAFGAGRSLIAAESLVTSVDSGSWSDPTIWKQRRIPGRGDKVEIAKGTKVVYDLFSYIEIGEIVVEGTLRFSRNRDTNLDVGMFSVNPGGVLEIGTEARPIPGDVKATVRIVNKKEGENSIDIFGSVDIHGQPLDFVYTRLSEDAEIGAERLFVEDAVDWKPGDRIVIASTTQNPADTEMNRVRSVEGKVVTLRNPLKKWHSGAADTSAEVANLTRNVVITSKYRRFRGHTRFLEGAQARVSYVEFVRLGARNQLGKYPVHFHMAGDSMKGSYVKGVSVWDSRNRFITVHSTQFVTLSDNVGYNALGHGFFMEMGDEVFVTWERNLGILVRPGKLLASDSSPAVFWIQNPVNTYISNIAVGSAKGSGFEFKLPHKPLNIGPLEATLPNGKTKIRGLAVLTFEGNEAHSNFQAGLKTYILNSEMTDEVSHFKNLKLWRNRGEGAAIRGNRASIEDSLIFGNGTSNVRLRGFANTIKRTIILGEIDGAFAAENDFISATPRGLTFWGDDNALVDSVLGGHKSSVENTGSDVSLIQDSHTRSTLSIKDTRLESERTIVFGYPRNGNSYIYFDDDSHDSMGGLLLFRLDAEPPVPCGYSADLYFIANVCRVTEPPPKLAE